MATDPARLVVRLFGPLLIEREGSNVQLPASRKTRAILGFLALSPRSVSRQRLCEMFFDLPDDPRAALRWSLSKLRPLLDDDDRTRLVSERDALRFVPNGADVDALRVLAMVEKSPEALSKDECAAAVSLMTGPLLEDAELPDRPEFSAWLSAKREDFQSVAVRLTRKLADAATGDERLVRLRELVALDPLDEAAAAALVRALAAAGRAEDADEAAATAERFMRQAGLRPGPSLINARRTPSPAPSPLIETPSTITAPELATDGRIDVAVIPFLNHSPSLIAAAVMDGFTEALVHMISRFRDIRVIGLSRTLQYKGAIRDPATMGVELGVGHLVGGSVMARDNSLRIRYRIVSAGDGALLTSGDIGHDTIDAFALIEDAPARLAALVARTLTQLAREQAIATPEHRRGAWDHYHAGVVQGFAATPANYGLALSCFEQAIASDERFARALGCSAWAKAELGYRENPQRRQEALMQAYSAIALGGDDAEALSIGALAAVHLALDFDAGLRAAEQAVRANPLSRMAWSTSGWLRAMAGEPKTPLLHFDRAEQCNPDDAHLGNVDGGRALCHLLSGRHDEAARCAERSLQQLPGHIGVHMVAMAAAMAAGKIDQACSAAERFLKVFPEGPATPLLESVPIRSTEQKRAIVAAVVEACRLATAESEFSVPTGLAAAERNQLSATPMVAVLPFADQSMEPLPRHVLDGFFEGLVHAMSRFRSIDLIAGASAAALPDPMNDPAATAAVLRADVLVTGSIARASDGRLRLRWRALEGTSGRPLALGDVEGSLDDVWDLQESAATAIAVEVEPRAQAEAHRVRSERPTASPAAYDLYLQGLFIGFSIEGRDYAAALKFFLEAIALDPNFHPALAMAPWAAAYANAITGQQDIHHYAEMSRTALRLGINDARTQATAGTALFYMAKDFSVARSAIDRAISLNRNEYTAWICGGWMHAMKGEAGDAHRMFDRSTRLNPLAYGANGLLSGRAMAEFMIGQIDAAEGHIRAALATDDGHPSALMTGIATAAALGLDADLDTRRSRFLAIYPKGLGDFIIQSLPFEDPACRDRYFDAVRAGGVPG